ncbi:MAG: hypothetical protein WAT55_08010 [Candidatus Microthrix parvicella]|nr:hypothetical protein [Candidatus Microthrix sp.]MBP9622091.1 hypothetical protein [Candidatus Microthrix sp.]
MRGRVSNGRFVSSRPERDQRCGVGEAVDSPVGDQRCGVGEAVDSPVGEHWCDQAL